MANIWTDKWQTNENHTQMLSSNSKQFLSARKHSAKKQVFGELKNIIHNQGDATPFKGITSGRTYMTGNSKSSLCVDVLRKQQLKQNFSEAQKQLEKKLKPPSVKAAANASSLRFANIDDAPFDFDLNVNTCAGNCNRSLEEIWGDMNMIDDAFLGKVIDGGDPDSDSEDIDKDHCKLFKDDYKFDDHETDARLSFASWGIPDIEDEDIRRPPFEFHMPEHSVGFLDDFPY